MIMDKNHKIWEMSDADFLNFLYQEREREYSKSSSWGINFWVVGAAIIGLLGYAYHAISEDYCSFDWRLVVYFSTVLGSMLILVMIALVKYLKNKNWTNKYRLTMVGLNSSTIELSGKRDIAIAVTPDDDCIAAEAMHPTIKLLRRVLTDLDI